MTQAGEAMPEAGGKAAGQGHANQPSRKGLKGSATSLPRRELLEGCRRAAELEPLIDAAERALRSWEPVWTGFLDAELREEAEQRLRGLSELVVSDAGGYPGAERRRLLLQRAEAAIEASAGGRSPGASGSAGLVGLEISGNFLFDPASPSDFRQGLAAAAAVEAEQGDLWLRGDRGAQAIVVEELAGRLDGQPGQVRTVAVIFEARPIAALQLPAERQPRTIATTEASLRLDAVASAGFGLSRQRMADRIREGRVRINWQPVSSPSRELVVGDRVRLEGKGELRIDRITPTKRDRFRIEMVRG